MGHLFVSYSRSDAEFVDALVLALGQYGLTTWRDVNALAGGEVWKAEISKAVRECDAFLLVLSPHSAGSSNVAKELAVGTKHARKVLPILIRPCRIPDTMDYDLAELQWIDFTKGSFVESMERLVWALGKRPNAATAATNEVQALRTFLANLVAKSQAFVAPSPAPSPAPPPLPPPTSTKPRYCIHCAAALIPGNAFCTGCGRRVAT